MGWLGWTEEQALNTHFCNILIAMEGKLEMLYPETVKKKPLNKEQFNNTFKAFVSQHNKSFSGK